MLTIRLQRAGKRNTAQYKLVLAKKTAANQKQFVEILGAYNPHNKELTIRDQERLNYWMNDQHVELSDTVHNLFITKELLKADKKRAFAIPKKEAVAEEASEAAPAEATEGEAPAESAEAPAETAIEAEVAEEVPEIATEQDTSAEVVAEASAEPAVEESTSERVSTETEETPGEDQKAE